MLASFSARLCFVSQLLVVTTGCSDNDASCGLPSDSLNLTRDGCNYEYCSEIGLITTQMGCFFEAPLEASGTRVCTGLCLRDFSPAEPEVMCVGSVAQTSTNVPPCEGSSADGWEIPAGEAACVHPDFDDEECEGVTGVVLTSPDLDEGGDVVSVVCFLENGYGEVCRPGVR